MLEGLIYQFVYSLERHRLFNIRLRHWLILLCFILPAMLWLRLWGSSYLVAVLVTLGAAGVLATTWWASRQRYVRFEGHTSGVGEQTNQSTDQQPGATTSPTMSKAHVCATGHFEVSGMRRYLVEAPASYTTFETRERCVMTKVPLTRLFLLGKSREDEVGWWYTFFQPNMIRSVASGRLFFGLRPRPTLRLEIIQSDGPEDETLYLSFDDEATLSLVLADLQNDATLA